MTTLLTRLARIFPFLESRHPAPPPIDAVTGKLSKTFADKRVRREMKRRLADHIASTAERDRHTVLDFDPRLVAAFDAFERASGTKTRDVLHRAADLITWLKRVEPLSIHELGSGRSSLVFSLWAKRHGIPYQAFEQSAEWAATTAAAVETLGGTGRILHVPARRLNDVGNRFVADIPDHADFIYLDGPHGGGETYPSYNGAPINLDVAEHLQRGCRPRTVLVDGRTETCVHIAGLPEAKNYVVAYQFKVLPMFIGETEIRRHTSFVLEPFQRSVEQARSESTSS